MLTRIAKTTKKIIAIGFVVGLFLVFTAMAYLEVYNVAHNLEWEVVDIAIEDISLIPPTN